MMIGTLGLIETIGLVSAIEAADAALKAANVHLVGLTKVGSGIVTIQLSGDVGAVTAAVEAGGMAASGLGKLRATHIIPRLASSVNTILATKPIVQKVSVQTPPPTDTKPEDIALHPVQVPEMAVEKDESSHTLSEEAITKMSNKQLREHIQSLGLVAAPTQLATMKKDELIKTLTQYYSEGGN